MMLGVLVCLILSLVSGISSVYLESSALIDIDNRLALATQSLSADIIYKHYRKNPDESLITSTLPLPCDAGGLLSYSKKPQENQLLEVLNLNNKQEVYEGVISISKLTIGDEECGTPKYLGKVYADDEEPFCKKFTALTNAFYDETGVADFDNPKEAADDINKYIKKQGFKNAKNLVKSSDIDKNGGLVYVSVLQIIASFNHIMDSEQPDIIFKSGYKMPALTLKDLIGTAEIEEMDATVYEFETIKLTLSLVVFYPNKAAGIGKVIEKLREPKLFNDVFNKLEKKCLRVTIPTEKTQFDTDLGKSFRQVRNVSFIFNPKGDYFKGIQKRCSTYVSTMLHKTIIQLDEKKPALPPSKNDKCSSYKKVVFNRPVVFFYITRTEKILPIPIASVYFAAP